MKWGRLVVLAVVFMMVLTIPVTSQAAIREDESITPLYLYTKFIEADLSIDSSGKATCSGIVKVYSSTSDIFLKVSLYEQVDTSWSKVTSWSDSAEGSTWLEVIGRRTVGAGKYKVIATATVTAESGASETISATSSIITYP